MKPAAPAQLMSLSVKRSLQGPRAKLRERKQRLNGWYKCGARILLQTSRTEVSYGPSLELQSVIIHVTNPISLREIVVSLWKQACVILQQSRRQVTYVSQRGLKNGSFGRLLGIQSICNCEVCFSLRFLKICVHAGVRVCVCVCNGNQRKVRNLRNEEYEKG